MAVKLISFNLNNPNVKISLPIFICDNKLLCFNNVLIFSVKWIFSIKFMALLFLIQLVIQQ